MGALKKIFFSKKKLHFLGKDEHGYDVIYPWGYPGEGFYISTKNKMNLITVLYLTGFSIILGIVGLNILINPNLGQYFFLAIIIHLFVWEIVPVAYFFFMKEYSRRLRPYVDEENRKPFITKALVLLLNMQICSACLFLYFSYVNKSLLSVSIMMINILYSIVLGALIVLSIKNNGRFLNQK